MIGAFKIFIESKKVKTVKEQIKPMMVLAVPIIITQAGQMLMGLVDSFMVGKISAVAIGSVTLGTSIFFIFSIFSLGLLSGLDFFIASNLGSGNLEEAHRWKLQGFYMAIIISVPLTILNYYIADHLTMFGVPNIIAVGTRSFLQIYNLSLTPFLMFIALRQYLQATGYSKWVTWVMVTANISNLGMNWVFINGKFGFPEMGIPGSALSTLINRVLMTVALIYFSFSGKNKAPSHHSWRIDYSYFKKLFLLGTPAALQMLFEVGVFSLSTGLASKLGAVSLAAHSIVLNIASFTFMIPLGISMAAAIRVAYYLGEKDSERSFQAGYAAFILSFCFMVCSGILLSTWGSHIIGIFTTDLDVIKLASKIIILAAIFQVADGIQVICTGAMRGLGETRIPAVANLIAFWIFGLPIGAWLCFKENWGLKGLWTGLALGLAIVASTLFAYWIRLANRSANSLNDRKDRLLSRPDLA